MGNSYSLVDIVNDLNSKHESVVLDLGEVEITLVNALRLDAVARKQVIRNIKVITEESESMDSDPVVLDKAITDVLEAVVADGKGKLLTEIIAGDTGLAFHLFDIWMQATQAGEVSSLPG